MGSFEDTATPDAAVSTITLAERGDRVVFRQGVGRPLLLIQGMSGTHDQWSEGLIEPLIAAGRALVCVNHRGVYRTPRPDPGYSIADLADDQAAALELLGIDEPVDVFGISMGGMVALELALRHPGKVRTLGIGCSTAGGPLMTPPDPADITRLFEAQQSGDRDLAMRVGYELNFSEPWWSDQPAYDAFLETVLRAPVAVSVIMGQLQAISMHDTGDRLAEITVPVAVLHGTADKMLPYPNAAPIHDGIPGATLEVFDGAGHLFYWEQPARTAEILEALSQRSSEHSASTQA